ncbi:hypothetical protein PFICI_12062 [Pestalotiopsis fici W106-1]|uniref:Uncharacterized protein n=1 Tax=Pestalotiopsis fici (strain W106-1 / CGMCC3.15140) TaxID=1229662 RepID=W3WS47_PESFW|nr:uncharacterized protein PFICI_12062 [Pestalotiopsis fici W106-1]ETS76675.1 hypothetical protein PFICI_12062 [Pestalotiopsis fici W106-1]
MDDEIQDSQMENNSQGDDSDHTDTDGPSNAKAGSRGKRTIMPALPSAISSPDYREKACQASNRNKSIQKALESTKRISQKEYQTTQAHLERMSYSADPWDLLENDRIILKAQESEIKTIEDQVRQTHYNVDEESKTRQSYAARMDRITKRVQEKGMAVPSDFTRAVLQLNLHSIGMGFLKAQPGMQMLVEDGHSHEVPPSTQPPRSLMGPPALPAQPIISPSQAETPELHGQESDGNAVKLRAELANVQGQLNAVKGQAEDLNNQLIGHQKEVDTRDEKIRALEGRVTEVNVELGLEKQAREDEEAERTKAQEQATLYKGRYEDLSNAKVQDSNQLILANADISQLRRKVEQLNNNWTTARSLADSLQRHLNNQTTTSSDNYKKLCKAREDEALLKIKLDKSNRRIADLEASVRQNGYLKDELTQAQGQNSQLQSDNEQLTGRCHGLEEEIAFHKQTLQERTRKITELGEELGRANSSLATVEDDLANDRAYVEQLQKEFEESQQKVNSLENRAKTAEELAAQYETNSIALNTFINDQLQSLDLESTPYEAEPSEMVAFLVSRIKSLRVTLTATEVDLDKLDEDHKSLKEQSEASKSTITDLRKQVHQCTMDATANTSRLEAELAKSDQDSRFETTRLEAELVKSNQDSQTKISKLESELAKANQDSQSEISRREAELSESKMNNSRLEKELEKSKMDAGSTTPRLGTELEQSKTTVSGLREQLEQSKTTASELQQALGHSQTTASVLQGQLRYLKSYSDRRALILLIAIQHSTSHADDTISGLCLELENLKVRSNDATDDLQIANEQLQALERLKNVSIDKIHSLENVDTENKFLKTRVESLEKARRDVSIKSLESKIALEEEIQTHQEEAKKNLAQVVQLESKLKQFVDKANQNCVLHETNYEILNKRTNEILNVMIGRLPHAKWDYFINVFCVKSRTIRTLDRKGMLAVLTPWISDETHLFGDHGCVFITAARIFYMIHMDEWKPADAVRALQQLYMLSILIMHCGEDFDGVGKLLNTIMMEKLCAQFSAHAYLHDFAILQLLQLESFMAQDEEFRPKVDLGMMKSPDTHLPCILGQLIQDGKHMDRPAIQAALNKNTYHAVERVVICRDAAVEGFFAVVDPENATVRVVDRKLARPVIYNATYTNRTAVITSPDNDRWDDQVFDHISGDTDFSWDANIAILPEIDSALLVDAEDTSDEDLAREIETTSLAFMREHVPEFVAETEARQAAVRAAREARRHE